MSPSPPWSGRECSDPSTRSNSPASSTASTASAYQWFTELEAAEDPQGRKSLAAFAYGRQGHDRHPRRQSSAYRLRRNPPAAEERRTATKAEGQT